MSIDDDLLEGLTPQPSKPEIDKSLLEGISAPSQTIGDYARRFAAGAADTFVTAPGAIAEAAGGSSKIRKSGQELSKRITDSLSPQAKAIDQTPLFDENWNLHPNPGQKILSGAASSAPSLIQAFAMGRPIQQMMSKADVAGNVAAQATRLGVPAKAGKFLGNAVEALPFSAVEGAASGGMAAADIMQQIEQATPEQLRASPRFNELLAGTDPALPAAQREAAAREALMTEAGRSAGLKTGAWTGGVGFLTEGGALGPIARRMGGKGGPDGFFKSVLKDGAKEAGQETPQSAGEQYFGNVATRDYLNPQQDPWQNVGQAGVEGGAIGFALGGGAGAATYRRGADGRPPEEAPTAAPPMTPPVPPGPISNAVRAGQQSGAIPTNPAGGPVDAPGNEEVTQPPGSMGKSLLGVAPSEASSDEKTSALSAIADIAAKVPADAPLAPDSPTAQAMAGAIERATAAGATQEDLLSAASGRVPPPDIQSSPKEVKAATKELDAAIDRVGKLTEKIARANAAADKARERGDEETAGNAESLAATLRDRLETARGQLETLQGAQRAGTGSGPVPGTDVGTGVLPADGRPRGGGDQPGRADAGGSVAAAGVPAGRPAGEGAGLAAPAVPPADGGGARPVVLQNRDRSSAASVAQMASIAGNPDPRRLSFSRDFGTGAPVVFANADAAAIPETQLGAEGEVVDAAGKTIPVRYAVVEAAEVVASNRADGTPNDLYADAETPGLIRAVAGNGRMAGLQEAFNRGTAAGYVEGIAADARLHGVDPEVIRGMQNPVLVRVMRSDDVTPDIGDRSNVSGISQLDPVEQARTDVARVNLDGLEFGEDGGPAVEAVRRFIRAMPDSEQSGLMDQSGAPGRQAVDRLMAAAFAKAYESDDLVRLYAQATDPEARNVISALAQAAGPMARLAGAGDLDIRPAVIEAAQSAVNASRRGVSLSKFSQQRDFDVTPEAWRVVEHFVANARSAKRMAEGLRSLAEAAYSEAQKGDVDMFGTVPKRTGSQIINEAFDGQQREGDANADAIAGRPRLDEEGAGGPGGRQDERTPANDPGQPQDADRPADGQAGDFDLVAPTREDILRQQEAAERAAQGEQTEDEAQARLDAEREAADQVGFLQPPPSGAEQRDTSGDMFGGPTADDVLAQRERERRNAPEAGGMFAAPVDEAAAQAATSPKNDTPEPTEAQKDAGNYKKGHVRIAGLDIAIENEAGTHRRPEWPALPAHYGYLKRTEGADGDQVDVFVKPGAPEDFAGDVFVIDQMVGGKFDEHKVMLGYPNQPAAAKAYRDAYTKDWKGLGAIRRMTLDEFKTWLRDGETTAPAAADFTLAGSDRPADQAAARGQQELAPAAPDARELAKGPVERGQAEATRDGQPVGRDEPLTIGEIPNTGDFEADTTKYLTEVLPETFTLYRSVWIGNGEKPNLDDPGSYWAETPEGARRSGFPPTGQKNRQVILDVRASRSDIDVRQSIARRRQYGEPEIVLKSPPGKARVFALPTGGQPIGRDGLTDAERASNRLDGIADDLAMQVQQESSERDFAPSDVPAVIEQWAKDNKVDAGELRTRVVDRLRKRLSEGRMRQVEQALSEKKPAGPITNLEEARRVVKDGRQGKLKQSLLKSAIERAEAGDVGDLASRLAASKAEIEKQAKKSAVEEDAGEAEIERLAQAIARADTARVIERKLRELNESRGTGTSSDLAWGTGGGGNYIRDLRVLERALEIANRTPPGGKIEDFGEKLEGARKDRARDLTREISDDELAAQPLSKSWPATDVNAIEDVFVAAFAHTARASVPPKPRQSHKLKRWVESVKMLRGLAARIVSGEIDRDTFEEKLRGWRGLEGFAAKVKLLMMLERDQWKMIDGVREYPYSYTYNEDGKKVPAPQVHVEITGRTAAIDGAGSVSDPIVIKRVRELLGMVSPEKKMQFEVRGTESKGFAINKKGDREYRALKRFPTAKEALAFVRSNYEDLVKAWESVKESDNVKKSDVRGEENRPRTGADRRGGKDVTPEQFEQAFGFRGVQFGNWVAQGAGAKDRQGSLNEAFDALHDLAEIVGIPPQALSLNGTLGLAFGARGHGWASAHFESDRLVINLTKTRGAGTLAHEWFHALDNYFARMRGEAPFTGDQAAYRRGNYITYRPEAYYQKGADTIPAKDFEAAVAAGSVRNYPAAADRAARRLYNIWRMIGQSTDGWVKKDAVRPEVEVRFAELVQALNESPMTKRSARNDSGADGYWSRIIERGARAFENFVIARMMQKGYHNDYLANVVPPEQFKRDAGRYPYLLPEELAPIEQAFDDLFGTIETRETDNGIALYEPSARYSVHEPQRPTQQIDLPLAEGGGASSGRPGLPGPDNRARRSAVQRVEATPEVRLETTPDPAGVYLARTELVAERHRTIHADRVTNPQEAAVALASVADYAVEHFHGLVTDKAGKPLALVGMFRGSFAETRVYAETIYAEAFRVKGAANIWFTHNHPSGKAEFSASDRTMFTVLRNALQGTGIKPRGFFAQTHSRGTNSPGAWVFTDNGHDTIHGQALPADIKASSQAAVPVVERVIVEQEPRAAITNLAVAKDAARAMQTTLGTDAPFVMLMSAQNEPIGAYPLKPGELAILRKGERAANLFRAVSTANARASILVDAQHALTDAELDNVAGALSVATGVRPLDALIGKNLASRMETGGWSPPHGSFFSRREKPVSGMNAKQVESVADRVRATWANGPEVVVLGSFSDAPAAVREAEARSKGATGRPEGFFHDGKVYLVADALPTAADVVRVLAHEALGHYGLRGLFGERLGAILDQIANVRRGEIAKKVREYGLPDTKAGRRVAAEEVLAVMAQTNPQAGFVKKAIAAIRQWLRKMGFAIKVTDADIIAQMIVPARTFVERGGAVGSGAGTAFSRLLSAPIWYSPLARAIEGINAKSQPASAWSAQITSLKGIKPDEIEWSGVKEWLALQQGKVTKDAVLEYLAGNGVRVEEVMLGNDVVPPGAEPELTADQIEIIEDAEDAEFWTADAPTGNRLIGKKHYPTKEAAREFALRYFNGHIKERNRERAASAGITPKFGNYRVPGSAENYRELLLTLPAKATNTVVDHPGGEGFAIRRPDGSYVTNPPTAAMNAGRPTRWDTRELAARWGIPAVGNREGTEFRGSHWDQPNVLAHIRIDERTDADGKRVLFINELQSDWGQRGRKHGFKGADRLIDGHDYDWWSKEADRLMSAKPFDRDAAMRAAENRNALAGKPDEVARGPFVENTSAWVGLALKRAIRYAVDNGFDRVALVNGEQAAKMFNLSEHVTRLYYDRDGRGYILSADGRRGEVFPRDMQYSDEELDGVVGKEIAQKIRNREGREDDENGGMILEGVDLEVGGEGMEKFYPRSDLGPVGTDKNGKPIYPIVQLVAQKVLKQLGGPALTTVDIYTPARAPGAVNEQGIVIGPDGERSRMAEQPGFDITPAMRDTVLDQGMPMFSRRPSAGDVQRAANQAARAIRGATVKGTWQRMVNAWTDKKPLALQLLGRRQIVDVYGNLLPHLGRYSDEMQQYDADKNESAAVADELVNRWRKLADADALADLMHDATLAQFDPDIEQAGDADQQALEDRFDGLGAEAKSVYREARGAYAAHWNKVKAAIRARIERADLGENERRMMMEQFRDQFLQPIQGVYFPLARWGDYVITAKDADGQRVVVFAESLTEAQAEHARMERELTDVSKITLRREYNAARDSVSKEFVRKLFETVDETSADMAEADLLKDAINQLYLTSLPDVSWAKHGIHRKGTPGYSRDARRAFAMNMFHGGYYLSKLRHADVLQDYLRAMQEHIEAQREDAAYDSITAQQVVNEMVKRHDLVMNPDNSVIANTLTGMGFVWFLGLSPASAIVNLSQTALVAYPIMAARFGYGKAADALTRASKEAVQFRNDLRGRYGAEENAAIDRAVREGLIDITQAHDLAGVSEGRDNQLLGALSPVMRAASYLFHQAEKFNRQATFIAVYRLARQAGEGAEQAYDTARDLTYKGHFDYACVDAETECLTLDGWKRYDELREGDVAIAVDANGRAVESRVSAVNIHRGAIPVTKFQSRQFSMVLTDNHDAVVQTYNSRDRKWQAIRKVRADSLKPSQHILRAPSAAIVRTAPKYGEDFAALLGWVAAEGWYAKYRKCKDAHDVRLAQSLSHNPEYVAEIRGILDRLGGQYKEYVSEKRQIVFFVLRRSLGARIQAAMPDKILTATMLRDMPADEMGALIDAFLKGDGSNRGRGDWAVGQKDGQNLDVLQAMAVMLGMRASQSPVDKQGRGMLHLGRQEAGHRSHVRPMSKERTVVDMVWCPTTEHGTWVARRGGRVFVTGNSSNRPRVMMGPVARVLLLFKQYGQNMIYTLGRNALLAAKGDREARRALSGILVAHGLTAGLMGLPLASVLMGLASIIGSDDDEPWDAEVALRNYLADAVGPGMGEVIAKGVFRSMLPGDISARVGLDSLLIRDIDLTLEPNQVWREVLEAVLGPVIGIGVNASRGAADLARGDLMLGIQGMLPKAVADGVKALRYATEGVKDRTGIEVLDEVTARDLIAQTLGFSPGRVREAYDARRAVYGQQRKLDDRRDELLSAFSKSVIAQDHETRLKTLQEIQHFNQVNPTMAITPQSMLRSIQNRMRRQAEAKDGIYLPRKQRDLAELGRFANTR